MRMPARNRRAAVPMASPRSTPSQTPPMTTGTKTAVLDPIEGLTDTERKQGSDYFTLMRANLHALRTGLGCR